MKNVTYSFHFTLSKSMGILIFLVGMALAFVLKSETIGVISIVTAGGLFGIKSVMEGYVSAKRNQPMYGGGE